MLLSSSHRNIHAYGNLHNPGVEDSLCGWGDILYVEFFYKSLGGSV